MMLSMDVSGKKSSEKGEEGTGRNEWNPIGIEDALPQRILVGVRRPCRSAGIQCRGGGES